MAARKKKPKKKLSAQQKLLIAAYFAGGCKNKYQAAREAGYSEATAKGNPTQTFGHPLVAAEIERRQALLVGKYELTEDWIIQRMMRIADAGAILAKFKRVGPDGSLSWDFTGATPDDLAVINELTTDTYVDGKGPDAKLVKKFKISTSDPKGALDSLMRHKGMFNDKVSVTGEVTMIERLQRGRERARLEKKEEK